MPNVRSDFEFVSLLSPISGEIVPLNEVPDPAFSQKMVGDGVAIDPAEGRVVAPCSGVVNMVHPSKHAISIQTEQDLEVLIHLGVDTVKLNGDGFYPIVEQGQRVEAGDLLMEFELDGVAQKAASLITPVLITNMDRLELIEPLATGSIKSGEPFYRAKLMAESHADETGGEQVHSDLVIIANPSGIHARPAAHLVAALKPFSSKITLYCGQRSANARSVVALMGLNIVFGDEVIIEAQGADAIAAVAACEAAIRSGLGENVGEVAAKVGEQVEKEVSLLLPVSEDPSLLFGVMASPGQTVGPVVKILHEQFDYPLQSSDPDMEEVRLSEAIISSRKGLNDLIARLKAEEQGDKAEIMSAHLELLDDPALFDEARTKIIQKASAPAAWQYAVDQQVAVLKGLNNPLMQARAADLQDVGTRVIRQLLGISGDPLAAVAKGSVVVSEELTPSEMASLDPSIVAGVITTGGSASSHAAIIARSMGLPMLAAVTEQLLALEDGARVLLDADNGCVRLSPADELLEEIKVRQAQVTALRQKALASAAKPAVTKDGVHVEVAANIGSARDALAAAEQGADGIGLLRSEFLYLNRVTAPDEDTQFTAYSEVLAAMGREKPVIVRTLDVGGDKPLAYLPLPKEENPFLGERGIRVGLDRPSVLRCQFRALLRSAAQGKLRIMLPMIASVDELRIARKVLEEERAALNAPEVELGIMIEVPSAAVMAEQLAKEADFFSVGTNDLTQYTLAIDRGNARLAPLADSLNPAVLRMIDLAVKGAAKEGKWVGVCGAMASDPVAIPLLLGLGVNELSVSVPVVAETKQRIRELSLEQCRVLASEALACVNAQEVRDLVGNWMK